MIKVTEIAFSCYPVTDLARARKFYEGVLGLKPTANFSSPEGMQWTEYDVGSGTLALGAGVSGWTPQSNGCNVGLEVEDFDAAVAHLRKEKVKFRLEPFPTPACHMAIISDPDNNTLVIHKRNTK